MSETTLRLHSDLIRLQTLTVGLPEYFTQNKFGAAIVETKNSVRIHVIHTSHLRVNVVLLVIPITSPESGFLKNLYRYFLESSVIFVDMTVLDPDFLLPFFSVLL